MAVRNILDTVGSLYNSLTKTEKRIAEKLLNMPEELNQCSLSEIAENLCVGEATFIRFCRTLGFKGFTDFKLALAVELATRTNNHSIFEEDISSEDSYLEIAKKLQISITRVTDKTISLLDFQELEKVVQTLLQAKRIFLFGVGTSGLSAEEAKTKFMRIGLQVDSITNNHFMYMQAALMNKNDVVIGISHSGFSQEIIQALEIAKRNKAQTIAITHNLRSPITKVADLVLINGNKQGQLQGDSLRTKIAQLFILDLIYTLIVKEEEKKATANKQKTLDVISEQRFNYKY
ncbi:MurR/RpiR family transcriptional regulator [Phocoenobacter skyensis]|uniref:DNA-binding transcriptional regulator, MurR/RpiR family, contains HTH and SIS domains n=1 Tax=Phocoenobacter skyensis TaxID=97481 RepID=A0A1H7YIU3_9PAST|nr:MurR/RpiR family transcriptional regulator [Pasteurella skyensis]MDP8079819.1 MurR/RpiR family transcriptional regulator [Pasteurella skyensis]MDP8085955.1 MurR/RpiR family transcriptional regulator [Pasteurella skyensis]MDP8185692.1 MurR/RpiR family transcriptional regulator [Pasteurella skyensis]QLB22051.1 N-acetylmannosamine kinase [Pasteurella skyensis]SEM45754.1 DNA-binding transcriptional regulator, MurR/RpiR family, contains HTH and SIS domains [Pasteurella skyensis]